MGDLGSKVGERIADIAMRAAMLGREKATEHEIRTFMGKQEHFFRLVGGELGGTIGPVWARVAEHPDTPEWMRTTGLFLANPRGQGGSIVAGIGAGILMGGGLADLITNELAPAIGSLIALNPHGIFTPADAAVMAARGLAPYGMLVDDAMRGGLGQERFQQLVAANSTYPTLEEALALYNRRIIDRSTMETLLVRLGYSHDMIQLLAQLHHVPLTAEQLASMWARSIVTMDEGAGLAAATGTDAEDFRRLTELAGQPPAPEILYLAYRRGIIDAERLERGIVQGPIRNEWFDVLQAVQFHSMTPEQAAGAVTQGHMTVDRGQSIAKEYGLDPEDFATLIETAGLPPGIEFAGEAYNRGFISDAEFGAMFLESRIKNRYLPLLRQMRTRLLPQETARSLLAKGVITQEHCMTVLLGHGFSPEDAAALIAGSLVEKGAATRDLSLSQTLGLYEEREISAEIATEMLLALGFDDGEAALILLLTDTKRLRAYRNAVITKIRSGVVAGLLEETEAVQAMDAIGVPPERRNDLLVLWDIEKTTVTRNLTPAQLVTAAKKQLLSVGQVLSRLVGQGYSSEDARVLLGNAGVQV